jgi:hypothetical protein
MRAPQPLALEVAGLPVAPDVGLAFCNGTHAPAPEHAFGAAHCSIDVHVLRHIVPSHLYGVQSVDEPSGFVNVWSPSHDAAFFATHACVAVLHVNIARQSASESHDEPHVFPLHA